MSRVVAPRMLLARMIRLGVCRLTHGNERADRVRRDRPVRDALGWRERTLDVDPRSAQYPPGVGIGGRPEDDMGLLSLVLGSMGRGGVSVGALGVRTAGLGGRGESLTPMPW